MSRMLRGDILDNRWVLALLVAAMAIPLLWPQIPPLVDLVGHMGRYYVQTHIDRVPELAQSFSFKWRLLGNLGVDLLIEPMGRLFGIELGTKLIVMAIPPLTAAGMLWLAFEVHGRIPQTALFALPLAYAYPFQFGFINFSLSVAFAFLALALWVRLGKAGRLSLRAGLFLFLSCLLWLTHMVGWGLFGLGAFGTELVRRRSAGEPLSRAVLWAGLACAPLALPLIPMAVLPSNAADAQTFDWLNLFAKRVWLLSLFRDRWQGFDIASALILLGVAAISLPGRWLRFDPFLVVPALLCAIAFVAMPRVTFGSAYADMRLLPFTVALTLLAIRPTDARWGRWLVVAGLLFLSARVASNTISYVMYDRSYRDELRALDQLPRGASVLSLVLRPCRSQWSTERFDHLPAMAIVRRDAFTNDQWTVDSAQALEVIKPGLGKYRNDPSQLIYPMNCRSDGSDLHQAVRDFNRAAFDHVWVLNGQANAPDLRPVWSNGHSTLYRVAR